MYYVVCAAALTGIVTSLLVGLYGTARIVMGAARDWLLPPVLATIYPRTQTHMTLACKGSRPSESCRAKVPHPTAQAHWGGTAGNAAKRGWEQAPLQLILLPVLCAATLAMLVSFDTLSDLVCLGTVLVLWLVANALLFRRYYPGLPRLRPRPGRD